MEHRWAYKYETMLSKMKIPFPGLMGYVLALDDSAIDVDQVDNLIKFFPTMEELDLIKESSYKGEQDKLGKCEQLFLEIIRVPRSEAKLRVFSYKLHFTTQVSDLRKILNDLKLLSEQIWSSVKLRRIMRTILSVGNDFNQGTARDAPVGFRLDMLVKLNETGAENNKMSLMHYLCKVVAAKSPELLDFSKELDGLEPASKIQLKNVVEQMQAIASGLQNVIDEKKLCKKDGRVSKSFRNLLKKFISTAGDEVKSLHSLYNWVAKSVDDLIIYFGEDPARCGYDHAVPTLLLFVRKFNQAHEENCKQIEVEKTEFFFEISRVPRSEAKLRVFSFKLHFTTQVSDLRKSLNDLYLSVEQIRSSVKLRRVMQTIVPLGNDLNQGTTRDASVGFRLDMLLKLNETGAENNKMTPMHYLCKVLADQSPELLDFSKELDSLEPASKIQLKSLKEEMQAITDGLQKVVDEKKLCRKDGRVSKRFHRSLENFLSTAEGEVKSLATQYSGVGKSVDALIIYFGEDPARCGYEHVVSSMLLFVRKFNQAHEESCKQIEVEKTVDFDDSALDVDQVKLNRVMYEDPWPNVKVENVDKHLTFHSMETAKKDFDDSALDVDQVKPNGVMHEEDPWPNVKVENVDKRLTFHSIETAQKVLLKMFCHLCFRCFGY